MRVWMLAALLTSCLGPTEVKLELTSDSCQDIARVDVLLDGEAQVASTARCEGNRVGSLVFVPSSQGDRFSVQVRATGKAAGATCQGAKKQCIEAARTVTFVPHTPLLVPVSLDRACFDRVCDPGATCYQGGCVPIDVSNQCRNGVCTPDLDAGLAACAPPWVDAPGPDALVWHFDGPGMTHTDTLARCTSTTLTTGPSMTGCGNAATGANAAAQLGCGDVAIANGADFHVAFWLRAGTVATPPILLQKIQTTAMKTYGWAILLQSGGRLVFNGVSASIATTTQIAPNIAPGGWHSVEIVVKAWLVAEVWFDRATVPLTAVNVGDSTGAPLLVGPLQGSMLDELYVY